MKAVLSSNLDASGRDVSQDWENVDEVVELSEGTARQPLIGFLG
jgi:hypothetical protein